MQNTIHFSPDSVNSRPESTDLALIQVQPYLFFNGRCAEALEFYERTLGATITMCLRFRDCPDPAGQRNNNPDKIMHAGFRVGATEVFASDGCTDSNEAPTGFSLSLTVRNEAAAGRAFHALADGGTVDMPLGSTFFSPRFGMLTDRFGVRWMVYVAPTDS